MKGRVIYDTRTQSKQNFEPQPIWQNHRFYSYTYQVELFGIILLLMLPWIYSKGKFKVSRFGMQSCQQHWRSQGEKRGSDPPPLF